MHGDKMQSNDNSIPLNISRIQFIILILFFLSGACGLIYEVIWQRMLNLIFGSTTFATATILASFMGGLALGSLFFGRFVDKHKKPLKLYAFLEAGIGIFAILFPLILSALNTLYVSFYGNLHTSFYIFSLIKFAGCFIVLFIPSFLMGGTLPVISKFFVRKHKRLGWGIGSLYGINTLGGVIGTFSAGFILISMFGIKEATYFAAFINILIAVVILVLDRFVVSEDSAIRDGTTQEDKEEGEIHQEAYSCNISKVVLLVYALSGFCALAYEVYWTRTLVFFMSNTTYSFPIMLTTFLFGSALGSLIFAKWIDKRKQLLNMLSIIEILIGVFAIFSIWTFSKIGDFTSQFWVSLGKNWYASVGVYFISSFCIMFVPTFLMGIAFPLVGKIYTDLKRMGRSIGNIYSVNTLGSVLGSLSAGFILIPLLGITRGIIVIAMLNFILGITVWLANPSTNQKVKWAVLSGIVLAVGIGGFTISFSKSLGLYSPWFVDLKKGGRILFYKEGTSATVTVHQWPPDPFDNKTHKVLEVDGINVAGTYPGLRITQKLQGHVPLLLYKAFSGKDPRNVFILGLGSGESSYSITRHNIKKVDCVELVAAEVSALPYFLEVNRNILHNPKFNLKIGDARNFLLADNEYYDVIESDSVHPMIDINTHTKEYFEICKKKLSKNGIFSTWIPLFSLSEQNFMILLKTFQSVFPNFTIWFSPTHKTRHALLIGTTTELKIDFQSFKEELQNHEVKKSLEEAGMNDIFFLLSCFITDNNMLGKYIEDSIVNTDNNLYLAHNIPKQELMGEETVPILLELMNKLSTPVFPYLVNTGEDETMIKRVLEERLEARKHVIQGIAYASKNDYRNEISEFHQALTVNPEDEGTRYMLKLAQSKVSLVQGLSYRKSGNVDKAIQEYQNVLDNFPCAREALYNLGLSYIAKGEFKQAEEVLQQALEIDAQDAHIFNSLGAVYMNMGMYEKAESNFKKAIQLDSNYLLPHANLGKLYIGRGLNEEALKALRRAVDIDPKFIEGRYLISMIHAQNNEPKMAIKQLKKILKIDPHFEPAQTALKELMSR